MNNYGKRLTRAEIFSALHGGVKGKGKSQTLADISSNINVQHLFGEIDDDTILRAILARRGSDVTRDIRTEFSRVSREFPNETPEQAYRAGEEALSRTVKFLQGEAGVPHFSFLSYRYLLVVLTRFFAHHPQPIQRNIILLKRWFWRAAIVGPEVFSGWTQAGRVLCSQITPNDEVQSVQNLLNTVPENSLKLPNIHSFRSTSSSTRILLCAMWSCHPRSFITGDPYRQEDLGKALEGKQTARNVVSTILRKNQIPTANRFIFLGEDSIEIEYVRDCFLNKPIVMTDSSWLELLNSHFFNADMRDCLIQKNDAYFLELREFHLRKLTADFLTRMIGSSFEDTPPLSSLIIDEDEDDEQFDEED